MDSEFYEIISLLSNWKSTQKRELLKFNNTIDELESEIHKMQLVVNEIKDSFSKFDSIEDRLTSLSSEVTKLSNNINSINRQLD
jgi:uncharacterized coiled-coil DUF342 family protein